MEYDNDIVHGSRRVTRQNGAESRGITAGSSFPPILPTRGFIRGNKIVTIDSRVNNRGRRGKIGHKELDDLKAAFNESKSKVSELETQNMRLRTLILESQNEFNLLKKQFDELYEKYSMLEHLEKWGDIIRQKNSEIKRQQQHIQKILTDRTAALNDMYSVEGALHGLRSKLRRKNREIVDMKAAEKINKKAVLLCETETLRNERDMALGRIAQRDAVIENLKLELKHAKEETMQKSMSIHDVTRRQYVKDKQNQVLTRWKVAGVYAMNPSSNHGSTR